MVRIRLLSVEETKAGIDQKLAAWVQGFVDEVWQSYARRLAPRLAQKDGMCARYSNERKVLAEKREKRQGEEAKQRQERFKAGFRGLWDRLTGRNARIKGENEIEAYRDYERDRTEKDALIPRCYKSAGACSRA